MTVWAPADSAPVTGYISIGRESDQAGRELGCRWATTYCRQPVASRRTGETPARSSGRDGRGELILGDASAAPESRPGCLSTPWLRYGQSGVVTPRSGYVCPLTTRAVSPRRSEQRTTREGGSTQFTADATGRIVITMTTTNDTDAERLELLDRIADRCPEIDLDENEIEWREIDGSEALLVNRGGIDGGNGAYFANHGDDVHAVGKLDPIVPGYVGCIVIYPDGSRRLAHAVPDPLAE
jgi:hypothetical protein